MVSTTKTIVVVITHNCIAGSGCHASTSASPLPLSSRRSARACLHPPARQGSPLHAPCPQILPGAPRERPDGDWQGVTALHAVLCLALEPSRPPSPSSSFPLLSTSLSSPPFRSLPSFTINCLPAALLLSTLYRLEVYRCLSFIHILCTLYRDPVISTSLYDSPTQSLTTCPSLAFTRIASRFTFIFHHTTAFQHLINHFLSVKMKTSSIVASVLFGSMAAAAPMLNKRAYVTHTSTLIQTEVTYTTVYADEVAPKASQTDAAFYEKTGRPSGRPTVSSKPVSSAAPVQSSTAKSSAVAIPKPSSSTFVPPPAPTTTQAPPKTTSQPPVAQPTTTSKAKPTTTQVQPPPVQPSTTSVAPVPAPSSSAPAKPSTPSTGGGETHSDGSMTIHPFGGALGSCGQPINDSDMMVALASDVYGASTYDVMTGNPTNKYCGMKINITYKGKTVPATIMDKCDGCTRGGLDVSQAIWDQLVGAPGDRLQGMSWTAA
ncbi:unnamed protein product [Periconia digitata]|uniref:Uncharacterized protein n=1 Tax=Periconia digitata TaxID=1303443 RepID=A0A9W4UQ82_9PLEO|nr:unnamed protein product [Periconia digitata]